MPGAEWAENVGAGAAADFPGASPPGAGRHGKGGGILLGRLTARIVPTGPCGLRGHRHPQGYGQLGQRQFRGVGSAASLLDVADERSRELSPAPQLCHRPPRQQTTAAQLRPVADPVRCCPKAAVGV